MPDIYLAPGLRTPFVKAGGVFAKYSGLELSVPIAKATAARAWPDFIVWGQVIPDPAISNIARELVFEAELDPAIPAFSTVLACSTSFVGVTEAAGMIGKSGAHLALVGGVETMSHLPLALKMQAADRIYMQFAKDAAGAAAALGHLPLADFNLPTGGWVNRHTGRSQGQHTEDTAKFFQITRADQDRIALASHQKAVKGQDAGFFDDLVLPFGEVERDAFPRRDTSAEKLAALPTVYDRSSEGTITAGTSSPNSDGAASIWVGDAEGLKRLDVAPSVKIVDWELAAIQIGEEGILMAPARAIPRLLARHKLKFADVALWEIHEAFAAQVLANVKAASDANYRRQKVGIDADLGDFPWERVNPNGGSLALGHPFAATGARILSQATKELAAMAQGARAVVSICADGGQGTVALLERV